MIKRVAFTSLALVGFFGLALAASAQDPGPRGGFGPGGPGGPGGGPGGGGRGSTACAPSCPQYQFTYTRTSVRPVLVAGGASTVTDTTTGTIAGDQYGSTYRDVTVSGWGSQSTPQDFIYVRDLDPGVMMNYIVNVTKHTYEQFPIQQRTPRGGGNPPPNFGGLGPKGPGPGGSGKGPTITPIKGYVLDSSYTCPDAEKLTITRGPDSTTNRVVCTTLHLLVQEDSTDPRFGSTTYKLSGFTGLTKFPFTPAGTLVQSPRFGHGGGPGGRGKGAVPPAA